MIRAWLFTAVVSAALALLDCHPRKQDVVVDAASEREEDTGTVAASAPASASAAPPALASAESAQKQAAARCAAGEVAVLLPGADETCVVECKSSSACPPGWACDGEGVLSHGGRPGGNIAFCRLAGRGKATDGGPGPSATPSSPPTQHSDAGAPAKKLDVRQVGGHCPAGYGACGAICRLTCTRETDCGSATNHCQGGFCLGPNAQPCGK